MNTPRSLPPAPPARGSFPLDHGGQCKEAMKSFLACMKQHGSSHAECRELSKAYLQCRMERGLMAPEDLNTMGFSEDAKVVVGKEAADDDDKEVVAGLASAKKGKGLIFGLGGGSQGKRGGGH